MGPQNPCTCIRTRTTPEILSHTRSDSIHMAGTYNGGRALQCFTWGGGGVGASSGGEGTEGLGNQGKASTADTYTQHRAKKANCWYARIVHATGGRTGSADGTSLRLAPCLTQPSTGSFWNRFTRSYFGGTHRFEFSEGKNLCTFSSIDIQKSWAHPFVQIVPVPSTDEEVPTTIGKLPNDLPTAVSELPNAVSYSLPTRIANCHDRLLSAHFNLVYRWVAANYSS